MEEQKQVSQINSEIIKKAKETDEEALEIIYKELNPFVKSMALKYFLAGADRDDVIQEGMIALFGAIQSYDETKSTDFLPFAKRCVDLRIKTAVKNSLRKKHSPLNESVSIENEELAFLLSSDFNPEDEYIANESYESLMLDLKNHLSPFEYSVLCLLNSGLNYKEIALSMDKEPKMIDNAIQRIKAKAKKMLKI